MVWTQLTTCLAITCLKLCLKRSPLKWILLIICKKPTTFYQIKSNLHIISFSNANSIMPNGLFFAIYFVTFQNEDFKMILAAETSVETDDGCNCHRWVLFIHTCQSGTSIITKSTAHHNKLSFIYFYWVIIHYYWSLTFTEKSRYWCHWW